LSNNVYHYHPDPDQVDDTELIHAHNVEGVEAAGGALNISKNDNGPNVLVLELPAGIDPNSLIPNVAWKPVITALIKIEENTEDE
jgi:hypothetical protein